MMKPEYAGKNIVIVGLGQTGLSCVRYLSGLGARVQVADSRALPPGLDQLVADYPSVPFHVGFDQTLFSYADMLVVSPGVPLSTPEIARAIKAGVEVCGDIELFARAVRKPVVAITGSNGKSTVTTLLDVMARDAGVRVAAGGNLGIPALDVLDDTNKDLYVMELSSFQLETTYSLNAKAAVVLNVSEDHMDRYDSLDRYADAKARIYKNAEVSVVNDDDAWVKRMPNSGRCVRFSLNHLTDFHLVRGSDDDYLATAGKALMPMGQMRMKGRHNAANALAALALGSAVGLPMDAMLETLAEFPGLPHRTEWVGETHGVSWYNDSKATNVGATQAAVAGFDSPIILIAGGQGKGQDFTPLHETLVNKTKAVILFGQDAERIAQGIPGSVLVVRVASMVEAVAKAKEIAVTGDVVLLSPACASFDMFKGFEDRGEQFCAAVAEVVS